MVPRLLESLIQAAEVGDEPETRAWLKKTAFALPVPGVKAHGMPKHSDLVIAIPQLATSANGNGHGGSPHLEESSL